MFTPSSPEQIITIARTMPATDGREFTENNAVTTNLLSLVAKHVEEGMDLITAYRTAKDTLCVSWMPTYMRVIHRFETHALRAA